MKTSLFLALTILTTTLSAAPTIASLGVKNAASYAYPPFPNGSIAKGSLFVVFGSAMGPDPIQFASSFPLPTTLAATSISVTVNGTTASCPMIYTSSGQLAAILPSSVPTGTGTMTVAYNGTASSTAPITVVTSSPGMFSVNQQGSGPAVVQDANGVQNALNWSFNPNQVVVIWATGLGPITGSDAAVPPTGNINNVTVTANVGGKAAAVQYSGRSQNAGVDQINIQLPADVPTGCYVPLYITATPAGGTPVTSNFGTISIAASGKTCSDPTLPNIGSGLTNGYKRGTVALARSSINVSQQGFTFSSLTDAGSGSFTQLTASDLTNGSFQFSSTTVGACTVIQSSGTAGTGTVQFKELDAGPVLNVNGPRGLKQMPQGKQGGYSVSFSQTTTGLGLPGPPSTPAYLDPGTYTIDNGTGGTDVGPFKLTLTVPQPFTWTNQDSITTVDRSQDLPITWTGGDPNSNVIVSGTSFVGTSAYMAFSCIAKDSDLRLTVPKQILSMLPPSSGQGASALDAINQTAVEGSAPGLDILDGVISFTYIKTVTYK
jgi:uncharacterized protein (TIGR03437 family)